MNTASAEPGHQPGHHPVASLSSCASGTLASAPAMAPSAPGSAATHSHCSLHTTNTFSNLALSAESDDACARPASAMSSSEESSAAAAALYCLCPVRVRTRCKRLRLCGKSADTHHQTRENLTRGCAEQRKEGMVCAAVHSVLPGHERGNSGSICQIIHPQAAIIATCTCVQLEDLWIPSGSSMTPTRHSLS